MPKYFKTDNFASFVRQLNMYEFHKIKSNKGTQQFFHPLFKKGFPGDLIKIKRKAAINSKMNKHTIRKRNSDNRAHGRMQKRITRLEKTLKVLTIHNQMLLRTNQKILEGLIHNRAKNNMKVKKMLIITYNSLKLEDDKEALNNVLAQVSGNMNRLKQTIVDSQNETHHGFSTETIKNNTEDDKLLENVLDTFYISLINPKPQTQPITSITLNHINDQREDDFLNDLIINDLPENMEILDNEVSTSNNEISISDDGDITNSFNDNETLKKEISFDCDRLDLQNTQLSPNLFRPYRYDQN